MVPSMMSNTKVLDVTKIHAFSKLIPILNKNIEEKKYDIIHNHASWRVLIFRHFINHDKILSTHHGPLNIDYQNLIFKEYSSEPYISISQNQRKDLPNLNYAATVYNGTDIAQFPFAPAVDKNAPLSFLARINPEKGPVEAAIAAQKSKKKIIIAAKVDRKTDPYYLRFLTYVDNNYVQFHGEMNMDEKVKFLQTSKALLVPIQWEEPFGLMFTEAMACGTPVITFARGSAPEIIKDGETGFLVNQSDEYIRGNWIVKKTGVEGLREAIQKLYSMSDEEYNRMRQASRKHIEENFTVEKMVDNYEKVYQQLISTPNP
jgi:glycosyltransferase involved in cell wall biosynthesis